MRNNVRMLLIILGMIVGGVVLAQDFNAQVKEKIRSLGFLIGEWEGESWVMNRSGEKETSQVTESITYDLSETLIKIRGVGKANAGGEDKVIHNALGILYYDVFQQSYKMDSWLAKGMHTTANVELLGDGKIKWWFEAGPGRTIRYTLQVENGKWNEVGEMSSDGGTWQKIFEMNLTKR